MMNRERETQELQERYGHLFDNFIDETHVNYQSQQQLEKESRDRYGHLVDYMKPDNTVYDDLMGIERACRNIRRQRAQEYEEANIRRRERREREKREEQENIERKYAFINSMLEKNEAERKALQEAEEQKRMEDEKRQSVINSLYNMKNIGERTSEQIESTRIMLERDEQCRKEYEEKMEWYRK